MTEEMIVRASTIIRGRCYGGCRKVIIPKSSDLITSLLREKLIHDTQIAIRQVLNEKYKKRHARRVKIKD